MLTAILIASLAGILAGGGGTLLLTRGNRTSKHDAAMEQARTEAVEAAAQAGAAAVGEALAPALMQVETLAEHARQVQPYCLAGAAYDAHLCAMDRLCTAQTVTSDGGKALACDAMVSAYLSGRQLDAVAACQGEAACERQVLEVWRARK